MSQLRGGTRQQLPSSVVQPFPTLPADDGWWSALAASPVTLAGKVVSAGVGFAATLLSVPARLMNLLAEVELLVAGMVATVARADRLVDQIAEVSEAAASEVKQVSAVRANAGRVVDDAAAVAANARRLLGAAEQLMATSQALLAVLEPVVRRGGPMLARFVDELEPHEVEGMIHLVDVLPALVDHLRDDVMPLLATLDRVGPDVHQLLEVTEDVRQAINGIPGLALLARRGADKEARQEAALPS